MGTAEVSVLADHYSGPQQGGSGLPIQNPNQPLGQGFPIAHRRYQGRVSLWGTVLGVLSSTADPCPLDARSTPNSEKHQCPRHGPVSPRAKSPLGKNHRSRGFSELSKPGDELVSTNQETDPEDKKRKGFSAAFS